MRRITATDALHLSIPERIQLVEDIWYSIAAEVESVELAEAENEGIKQRLAGAHQNPNSGSTLKDVYNRIVDKK